MHLITRPMPQAETMAAALTGQGEAVLVDSLLIEERCADQHPWEQLTDYAAVLTTSPRAVTILAECTAERAIPLWVVGESSAVCARRHGFEAVYQGGGNVLRLIQQVETWKKPHKSLLYLSAADITVDLPDILSKKNIKCDRWIVYAMRQKTTFAAETIAAFHAGAITRISLYSKRTVAAFVQAVRAAGVSLKSIEIGCASPAILTYFQALLKIEMTMKKEDYPCCILIPMDVDQTLPF